MMDWLAARPLLRFALSVIALLPACFVLWNFAGTLVAAPAIALVKPVLLLGFPDLVDSVSLQESSMMVMSKLGEDGGVISAMEIAGNQLGWPISTRTLSYSIPFYAALHFATPQRASLGYFGWALVALWLLLALGLLSTTLKELMLGLGQTYLNHPRAMPADAVALSYQFSTLIVPALAPVILWAYGASDSPLFRALLPSPASPAQDSERST